MLLPFIDDKNNYELHRQIYDLKDISIKKSKNEYLISKIQHSRYCKYTDNHRNTNLKYHFNEDMLENGYYEYEYNINDVMINYALLLDTIQYVSNKLYVEWFNIRPISIDDYKNSVLYKNTIKFVKYDDITKKKLIKQGKIDESDTGYFNYNSVEKKNIKYKIIDITHNFNINKYKYRGLFIGDFYNVIHNDLYLSIKKYKWLIFDNNNIIRPVMYITVINNYFNIHNFINNTKWNMLTNDFIKSFNIRWNNFINHIYNKEELLYLNIMSYFENITSYLNILENDYDYKLNINYYTKKSGDLEGKYLNDHNKQSLKNNINKIPIEYIYYFLRDSIYNFSKTWYGRNIIKFKNNKYYIDENIKNIHSLDKNNVIYINIVRKDIIKYNMRYKNIYNFSKSIIYMTKINDNPLLDHYNNHYLNDKFKQMPNLWISLDHEL